MTTPGNDYLQDPAVQQQLATHDRELITQSVPRWFPGDPQPAPQWDFNRKKEVELLAGYTAGFSDLDFRDGHATVEDATQATYGTSDEYLRKRIVTTHLQPGSGFNKEHGNGQVIMVGPDGVRLVRNNRVQVASDIVQKAADDFAVKVLKRIGSASKQVVTATKKSNRIAPGHEDEHKAIAAGAADYINVEQRRALGQG